METLQEIEQDIDQNMKCPLKDAALNLVFGKGNSDADIIFIGEAPGAKEDEQGIPFVGAAGKELDRLLHTIGLTLKDVYIANILKYRPPNNRNPNVEEIKRHTPYLIRQIKCIKPKIIATLGNFSTKFVLAGFNVEKMKNIGGITTLHGTPVEMNVDDFKFIVIPLFHPAAILYNRSLAPKLEEDFQKIKSLI
jgi:uracil-DNA glycosylase